MQVTDIFTTGYGRGNDDRHGHHGKEHHDREHHYFRKDRDRWNDCWSWRWYR